MVGAELRFQERQRHFVELEGLGVPAEVFVGDREVVDARQGVGVVGARGAA